MAHQQRDITSLTPLMSHSWGPLGLNFIWHSEKEMVSFLHLETAAAQTALIFFRLWGQKIKFARLFLWNSCIISNHHVSYLPLNFVYEDEHIFSCFFLSKRDFRDSKKRWLDFPAMTNLCGAVLLRNTTLAFTHIHNTTQHTHIPIGTYEAHMCSCGLCVNPQRERETRRVKDGWHAVMFSVCCQRERCHLQMGRPHQCLLHLFVTQKDSSTNPCVNFTTRWGTAADTDSMHSEALCYRRVLKRVQSLVRLL